MKLKVFEGFTGYGGAGFGLQKAGIDFEVIGYSEIDKGAIKCFEQNFPNIKNYGDISKINPDDLPNFDLFTGGFPCQDVSIAGERDLSKGRTNLYLEIIRIVSVKKPKFLLLENVKGLLSMEIDEGKLIDKIVRDLQKIGYGVCWKVLNSKNYGIPQNRERVWFVCKLGSWDFMEFQFPNPIQLEIFLKDILEKEIEKKYYLSNEAIKRLVNNDIGYHSKINPKMNSTLFSSQHKIARGMDLINEKTREVSTAINVAQDISNEENKPVQLDLMHLQHGEIRPLSTYIPQDLDISRCLQSGEPKEVLIEPQSVAIRNKNRSVHQSKIGRKYGDFEKEYQLETREDGVSYTIKSATQEFLVAEPKILDVYNHKIKEDGISITLTEPHHNNLRLIENNTIRKLTPKECFRLMGFLNDEINLDGLSDTAKYKLAGNGWDINLVSKIFKRMFKDYKKEDV